MDTATTTPDQIRTARKHAGKTQAEMARLAGCSRSFLKLVEAGYAPERSPALRHIVAALTALGHPPTERDRGS